MLAAPIAIPISFEHDGFALLKSVVPDNQLSELGEFIEASRKSHGSSGAPGLRHLLRRCEAVRSFSDSAAVRQIVSAVLGTAAKPVRSILFDKTPESNWYVTWHQDQTIAVNSRIEVPGFGPWSTKDGISCTFSRRSRSWRTWFPYEYIWTLARTKMGQSNLFRVRTATELWTKAKSCSGEVRRYLCAAPLNAVT